MDPKWRWKLMVVLTTTSLMGTLGTVGSNLVPRNGHEHGHHCSHQHPRPEDVVLGVVQEPYHVIRKRSIDQPLRIVLHYDKSVYELEKVEQELIQQVVLPQAVEYWQKALMVRRTDSKILLSRRCPLQQVFYRADDPHSYCRLRCEKQTLCGEVPVPEEHLDVCRVCDNNGQHCGPQKSSKAGEGIANADFVFYVSALHTERCKQGFTVAYAAHCQQEAALDRPIAGHANLCPQSISTKAAELDTLISTVKHEILHALGFSVSLYAFFRDDSGKPLTPRDDKNKPQKLNELLQARQWSDSVIRTVTRRDWRVKGGNVTRQVQMIVTPRVVEEVRRHFDCEDLEGAELEDQGGLGTALTHWEKRIFENEAMTGTHTQNPVYSRITLALMEDTGWYRANYELAQNLDWGDGLGCDFVKKSCMEWITRKQSEGGDPSPYCNKVKSDPLETQCTEDHNSVALCNLIKHEHEIEGEYQNFDWVPNVPNESNFSLYGGSVVLADYCPYVQEFIWRANNVIIRGSHCQYEENNPDPDKNFALEEYGEKAKCFYHTREMWEERSCTQKRQWQHWGSGCYNYLCEEGLLKILVANKTFTCAYPGQELKVQITVDKWLHKGGIKCPSCEKFCDNCSMYNNEKFAVSNPISESLRCGATAIYHKSFLVSFNIVLVFVIGVRYYV